MPEPQEDDEGNVMAGDRRLSRADNSLPDWQMPDGAYRPVPIVWFTGAFFLQWFGQGTLALVLSVLGVPPIIVLAVTLLATGLIGHYTWERGMAGASLGWRISTVVMLLIMLGFTGLALLPYM